MQLRTRGCLDNVVRAGKLIQSALAGVSLEEYLGNWEKQSAVERQFMIIGEALVRIRKDEPEVFQSIPKSQAVIAFRNLLVHGYDSADPKAIFQYSGDPLSNLIEFAGKMIANCKAVRSSRAQGSSYLPSTR